MIGDFSLSNPIFKAVHNSKVTDPPVYYLGTHCLYDNYSFIVDKHNSCTHTRLNPYDNYNYNYNKMQFVTSLK